MRTVSAAFTREYFAAICEELLQGIDIFIIDIGPLFTAESALRLLANDVRGGFAFRLEIRFGFHFHSHFSYHFLINYQYHF